MSGPLPRYVYLRRTGYFCAQLPKPATGQSPIYIGVYWTATEAHQAVQRALAARAQAAP